jgi:hypothetical protein
LTTDTVGGTADGGYNGLQGNPWAVPVTASASGTLTTIGVNMYDANTGRSARVGLYTDNGSNRPNSLICESNAFTPVNGWNDVAPTSLPAIVTGTKYWIAIQMNSGYEYVYVTTAADACVYGAALAFGAFDATFNTPTLYTNGWNLRITYASSITLTVKSTPVQSIPFSFEETT